MHYSEIDDKDRELIAAASRVIEENYCDPRHTVGAAVLCASGRTYAAVNIESCGYGPCAEPIAIGCAISNKERSLSGLLRWAVYRSRTTSCLRAETAGSCCSTTRRNAWSSSATSQGPSKYEPRTSYQIRTAFSTDLLFGCDYVAEGKGETVADLSLVTYCGLYCGLCAEHRRIPRHGRSRCSRHIMVQKDWSFGVLNVQPEVGLRAIRKPGIRESQDNNPDTRGS